MWIIYEPKDVDRILSRAPKQIVKKYEFWKRVAEMDGPIGLKRINGFEDEALKGNWDGYRSSRLNDKWRIIYKVIGKKLEIDIEDINPHKY